MKTSPKKKRRLTPYQRRAVATVAIVHPRTVDSWDLETRTPHSTTVIRIVNALHELGLEHVLEERGDA